MSPDARFIPARNIDAHSIKSYPYTSATTMLPNLEEMLPSTDTDEPLGAAYSETPEELEQRLRSTNQMIAEKLAKTEHAIAEKMAQTERGVAEKMAQAERDVAEKMAQADQQAAETNQRAYEEGYATGEKEGRTFAESQFKVHLTRLEDSLEELAGAVSLLKNASEDEVLALVTIMAEYLAGQHLDKTLDAAGPLLRSILEAHPFPLHESAAPGEPAAMLYMNPKDLEQSQDSFATEYPGMRLVADPELGRGSLKLETADTVLDATFEKRRERLLHIVTRLMEEGSS